MPVIHAARMAAPGGARMVDFNLANGALQTRIHTQLSRSTFPDSKRPLTILTPQIVITHPRRQPGYLSRISVLPSPPLSCGIFGTI
ncbi:unnamed protein product [Blumeria hordei]|uniref:Uncharacterized protein n=1 Tax=Blumeria hordei TaxID=2867405 RepID=A0A383UV73_BLUHO|nr:unnamed protein product [Blumeria hordei]